MELAKTITDLLRDPNTEITVRPATCEENVSILFQNSTHMFLIYPQSGNVGICLRTQDRGGKLYSSTPALDPFRDDIAFLATARLKQKLT